MATVDQITFNIEVFKTAKKIIKTQLLDGRDPPKEYAKGVNDSINVINQAIKHLKGADEDAVQEKESE